ncbi:MAG: DegQ family serine endoprotease [bacterium]
MFRSKHKIAQIAIGALLIAMSVVATLAIMEFRDANRATAQEAVPKVNQGTISFEDAVSNVVDAILPAVVHIEVEKSVEVSPFWVNPFEGDPLFRYFFGEPRRLQPPERQLQRGLGSGMIIDGEGHILTNNHVVADADKIKVKLTSGEEMEAKLVGADPKTDLAVIKIKPTKNMKYVTMGDSDKIRVGQWVIAIGHPRGLDHTVTVGVVSAKNREGIGLLGPSGYEDYIQTDAAINPGNSGGPLVNLRGEVIGVNSAIFSTSGGSQGIGFAIPSNMARNIAQALISQGKVIRGWLGIFIQDLTPEIAQKFGIKGTKGALIAEVPANTPAQKAGLKQGDVIIEYNGSEILNTTDLRNKVASTKPGTIAELKIIRDKREQAVKVKIETQPSEEQIASLGKDPLGLRVQNITPEIARNMGLDSTEGVVIAEVQRGSRAAEAGLEAGDIILQINNTNIKDIEDYNGIVSKIEEGENVLLLVRDRRTGNNVFVVVRGR